MSRVIDETHDPERTGWPQGAAGHGAFPVQNLPFGIFSCVDRAPRGGIAIGDQILDLGRLAATGLLAGDAAEAARAAAHPTLNAMFALGARPRRALRRAIFALLSDRRHEDRVAPCLVHAADATMHLPCAVGDYTDFYAGIHHATAVGKLFRPDNPLLPNYKHVPIGYHGRASSVVVSGTGFRRPCGQTKPAGQDAPQFGPSQRLDYELELGIWLGRGNALGEAIPIAEAPAHIAGFCLLNDWSARDIQAWEYQPLGPFLAKNFCTTVSAWVVTPEALTPFRVKQAVRPVGDPAPLPYLHDPADQAEGAIDLALRVTLLTPAMRAAGLAPVTLSQGNARDLYWTVAQLVAHHASNGCNLASGDLLGTGTISAPDPAGAGSLLELTEGGKTLIRLGNGETRSFLEDGDEIGLHASATRPGFVPIGFGSCIGQVQGSVGC